MVRVNTLRGLGRWAGASFAIFLGLAIDLSAAEPAKPANSAVLPRSTDAPKRTLVHGRVLLPDGAPAAGALVTVNGPIVVLTGGGGNRILSNVQSTACNNDGEFSYDFPEWVKTIAVRVNAPGTVATMVYPLLPAVENVVQLSAGARVSGRVLRQAKGIGGIQVVLVSVSPDPLEKYAAETNDDGRFTIDHVHPVRDHQLFVPMDSVADDNLAAVVQSFRTGHEGQLTEVAELNLHPACTVRGKVVMSKGENSRGLSAVLGRSAVSGGDSQSVPVGEDGTFVLRGVPKESVMLWITEGEATSLAYRPSSKNHSLDPVQRDRLCGRVDEDLALTVLLDPITAPERTLLASENRAVQAQAIAQAQRAQAIAQAQQVQANAQAQRARLAVQVNGRVVVRANPYAPSDERTARQKQLLEEPLRGVSESPEPAPSADKQP